MNDTPSAELAALESEFVMATFKRLPIELVQGEGAHVVDSQGRSYLDFVAGIAVNVLGHAHPAVVRALGHQAETLIHTSNLYYTRPQVEVARMLNELGFQGRAFFANSGAEANETAIKIARKWGKLHRGGAFGVISALGSFHGRTLATLAATGQPQYQKDFTPLPEGFSHVPYNDIGALREGVTSTTVAVMLEPIQGESGIVPADDEYLREVRRLCDEENLLLIFDEIQTGMGRTGTFFAFQGVGVTPDVVTLAKGLGGGVPIGVCLANQRGDVLGAGDHGSTFGGNPLSAAVALAVLQTISTDGLADHAGRMGNRLRAGLDRLAQDSPLVALARGKGLMQAVVLNQDLAPQLQTEALSRGLIVNAIGQRVIRLVPPLIVSEAEVDQALDILERSLAALAVPADVVK